MFARWRSPAPSDLARPGSARVDDRLAHAGQRDDDPRQEQLQQRPDRQRVEHGAEPDGPAEQEADRRARSTSSAVRTSRTDQPVRRTSPVISPSRGPGPSCAPM